MITIFLQCQSFDSRPCCVFDNDDVEFFVLFFEVDEFLKMDWSTKRKLLRPQVSIRGVLRDAKNCRNVEIIWPTLSHLLIGRMSLQYFENMFLIASNNQNVSTFSNLIIKSYLLRIRTMPNFKKNRQIDNSP
jgi:hypothetical protein